MWKRLNNNRGARPTMSIGDPILTETTLDGRDYPGLGFPNSSPPPERQPAPLRPARPESKGLPSLPFEAMPPSPPDARDSGYRVPSSIYSERYPPPINTNTRDSYATVTTSYTTDDISPPSSPEMGTLRQLRNANANDDNVSPIDEVPDMSQLDIGKPPSRPGSSSNHSSIPVLRREKRRNQVAAAAANLVTRKEVGSRGRPTQDPRWDPYSGEITTSDRGKPQSVKPGQFSPPTLRSVHNTGPYLGNESNISAAPKAQTSFADKMRKLKVNNNLPAEKPGWKGASGRVTLVTPVADNLDVKPLNIPRKSSKRVASPDSEGPVSQFRRRETGELTSPLSSHPTQEFRPVHSNSGRSTPRMESPISVIHDPFEISESPAVESQGQGYKSNIQRDDTQSTIERNFREALAESFPQQYEQPPSRFSVTTYDPSTAHATPRPSTDTWEQPWEQPEMPPLPTQAPSPILNRKRPQVLGDTPKVNRKAVAPSSPVFISMTSSQPPSTKKHRQSTLSTTSTQKNLPATPSEIASASSNDLILSLQAQMDNLQHQRLNISKSIRQMTELMPQDGVLITSEVRRKREEEKRKVEVLRAEEAEIRREEHELGLKLHRAWKRRERDEVVESTTLWVRRVTG